MICSRFSVDEITIDGNAVAKLMAESSNAVHGKGVNDGLKLHENQRFEIAMRSFECPRRSTIRPPPGP
jgi:hypothetical protein